MGNLFGYEVTDKRTGEVIDSGFAHPSHPGNPESPRERKLSGLEMDGHDRRNLAYRRVDNPRPAGSTPERTIERRPLTPEKPHVEMSDQELMGRARGGDKRAVRELNERGQTALFPEAATQWVTIEGRRIPMRRGAKLGNIIAKYSPMSLRPGRQAEQRPGMVPLSGLRAQGFAIPDDPYQYTGQPRPLPKISPGPHRAVPPTWPARDIAYPGMAGDDEVGRATYPGSPEPVRVDTQYGRRTKPVGGDLTVGAQFIRNVDLFASHYGEGRSPRDRIEPWRGNGY